MTDVRKLEIRVNQTGNAAAGLSRLTAGFGSLGGAALGVAAVGIAAVTAGLVALTKQAITTAADFEEQMNILEVAARSTGTSFDDLSEAAIMVGADTKLIGITASESADAMTNLYKAGLTTSEIFGDLNGYLAGNIELGGALRAAIDLASASEMTLADTSELVAVAMATFGLGVEDVTNIADNFVGTADASVASVQDLAFALQNIGPTAAQFGWSLEDVNVALALLSERGIKGSEAGTALKSMMTNWMRDTKKVDAAWKELNITLYNFDGTMKDLDTIVGELSVAMRGMTDQEKNLLIQTLAGTYGMKAMQTLMQEGLPGWAAMEEAIGKAATAQEVAEARTKGLKGAMEQLEGSIESMMIRAGTPLIEELLTPAIQLITEWLPTLEEVGREALPMMGDALTRIVEVFNDSNEEMSTADALLWALKITLDIIVFVIKDVAKFMGELADVIEELDGVIRWVIKAWDDMKRAAQDAVSAIPDWLRPGSPTPFEVGLRGIADAASQIDLGMGTAGLVGAPAMAGGGITVNLYYNPAVSLANQYEAERVLAPYIAEALRKRV